MCYTRKEESYCNGKSSRSQRQSHLIFSIFFVNHFGIFLLFGAICFSVLLCCTVLLCLHWQNWKSKFGSQDQICHLGYDMKRCTLAAKAWTPFFLTATLSTAHWQCCRLFAICTFLHFILGITFILCLSCSANQIAKFVNSIGIDFQSLYLHWMMLCRLLFRSGANVQFE